MRFIADVMLGKLARWLRILGYDVTYYSSADDEALVEQAIEEKRTLLTKDQNLIARWRKKLRQYGYLLLMSDDWQEQLLQIVSHFGLTADSHRLTRCPNCNGILEKVGKESVRYKVPFFVFQNHNRFARCLGCGKVYWAGSHYEKVNAKLDELLKKLDIAHR